MTPASLDPLIHPPKRLAAMALLEASEEVDFGFLRDYLEVSDSDLSKQMKTLVEAGYATARKTGSGRGGTTTYRISGVGRIAYVAYLDALARLLRRS